MTDVERSQDATTEAVPGPTGVLTALMPAIRQRHDLTAQEFAECVRGLGLKFDRGTVSKIENGLRGVSLDEALIIAAALDVAPVHLFLPRDDNDKVGIGNIPVTAEQARRWFRGQEPLPGRDDKPFRTEVPESEWRQRSAREVSAQEEAEIAFRRQRVAGEKLAMLSEMLAPIDSASAGLIPSLYDPKAAERRRLEAMYDAALQELAEAKVDFADAERKLRLIRAEKGRNGGE